MESGGGEGGGHSGPTFYLRLLETSGGRVPFRFVLCGEGCWGEGGGGGGRGDIVISRFECGEGTCRARWSDICSFGEG